MSKEWHNYELKFNDGSVYYGVTSDPDKREKQHKRKWKEPFEMILCPLPTPKKSEALALEAFKICRHFLYDKRSTLRNRYIGRFSLPS